LSVNHSSGGDETRDATVTIVQKLSNRHTIQDAGFVAAPAILAAHGLLF
jgi:hypothetical protein